MAIGGFNNEGGHLSLAQFQKYVQPVTSTTTSCPEAALVEAAALVALSAPAEGRFPGRCPDRRSSTSSKGIVSSLFGGNAGSAPGGGYSTSAITTWVESHFHKQTIGGETVYNLTERS